MRGFDYYEQAIFYVGEIIDIGGIWKPLMDIKVGANPVLTLYPRRSREAILDIWVSV